MSEINPYRFLEHSITQAGFDYNSTMVEIAYADPQGKALFQILNATSLTGLNDTDWPSDKKDRYKKYFYGNQLRFYQTWKEHNPDMTDVLETRIDRIKTSIEELNGLEPLCPDEVYTDFNEVVCRMLSSCPVQLKVEER